ncbi:Bug family tripartite tricarboxylate transporter substrate binding protein [Fusibacter ferrireducens]|uniref:Tripartite tricarboxylate transporter substrate binding protein n=1 Tax=Fusibacter ferrireducens TaxID=2785058 RepID=A0ABR9ZUY9_9FIRM|nr:tripartite tricarboxylate transporter substrate binding protein [Fusibacter ferrireducens]MBF4694286.1 tripartite tricarboxylate transporter substrate binding protein [Fusibacter ferrireducens]
MKKIMILGLIFIMIFAAGCSKKAEEPVAAASNELVANAQEKTQAADDAFPTKNISGIVQWGAGGGTDSLMRPLATLAEKHIGQSIVVENKTGGTGSIATQYVHDAAADGYTLLMGAENPQLYTMLDIINLTYKDFEPVIIIGDETVGITVGKNSKYATLTELIDAAKANPGTITLATTGKGGLPWSVASYITAVTGATFNQVPYDSDASARTAVISGECDLTVAKIQSGLESHLSGDWKYISLFSKNKIEKLEEVSLITDDYPDFDQFLPWGPFYGVFVNAGTDQAVIDKLSESFMAAFEDSSYQEILASFNINPLGIKGEEAKTYLKNWQLNTAEALYKSGSITKSPEELGLK